MIRSALLVVLFAALLLPAGASARKRDDALWATVNVCDTARNPDAIGIRASMPTTPRGARLSMRFRVQYRTADAGWKDVADADSGWRVVRPAKGAAAAESGWGFNFATPAKAVTLRGVVRFRWRRGSALPRQAELATEAGHRSSAGADPEDYSAATCVLSD
jgi:hypothetical protein